ncbi:hypothetical protein HK102_011707 [Quaeritorhiza haematococci]|nr:hypothetical protein HK102_011707 [Quaeritorhiza haematococci]
MSVPPPPSNDPYNAAPVNPADKGQYFDYASQPPPDAVPGYPPAGQSQYYPPAGSVPYPPGGAAQYPPAQYPGAPPPGAMYVQAPVVLVNKEENEFPIGLFLFLGGFCFTPLWWVGCCYPQPKNARDSMWRKVNIGMTVLSFLALVLIIVWYIVIFNRISSQINSINSGTRP